MCESDRRRRGVNHKRRYIQRITKSVDGPMNLYAGGHYIEGRLGLRALAGEQTRNQRDLRVLEILSPEQRLTLILIPLQRHCQRFMIESERLQQRFRCGGYRAVVGGRQIIEDDLQRPRVDNDVVNDQCKQITIMPELFQIGPERYIHLQIERPSAQVLDTVFQPGQLERFAVDAQYVIYVCSRKTSGAFFRFVEVGPQLFVTIDHRVHRSAELRNVQWPVQYKTNAHAGRFREVVGPRRAPIIALIWVQSFARHYLPLHQTGHFCQCRSAKHALEIDLNTTAFHQRDETHRQEGVTTQRKEIRLTVFNRTP
ncbi:hypothetical protein D3C84_654240 [compost metagenome]